VDAVQAKISFDQRILERRRAKWSQSQPRRHQTKGLAEMAGVQQNHAIAAGEAVLPQHAGKNCSHEKNS